MGPNVGYHFPQVIYYFRQVHIQYVCGSCWGGVLFITLARFYTVICKMHVANAVNKEFHACIGVILEIQLAHVVIFEVLQCPRSM